MIYSETQLNKNSIKDEKVSEQNPLSWPVNPVQ